MLSDFLPDAVHCLCFHKTVHALMLLWDECGYLLLDGGHLLIKLPQSPHKMAVSVNFCCEGTVLNAGQCRVHFRKLVPGRKELLQVLDRTLIPIIETGRCMDFSSVCRAVRCKLAESVGVGCHEHCHILGRNGATMLVDDGERNVIVLVILLIPIRDWGLTMLDSYTPLIPGMVQPDRAFLCFHHTLSTSSSPTFSAM